MKWVERFRTALRYGKDLSLSLALQRFAQHHLKKFGHMQHLVIDSKEKTIRFELLLKGETQPIELKFTEYDLTAEGLHTYFLVKKAEASRAWIQTALEQFVLEKKFQVPDSFARILKTLL